MQAQGRGQGLPADLEGDDEGTESEYDEDYEDEEDDEEISDDEYELDHAGREINGSQGIQQHSQSSQHTEKPVFGPPPPPNLLEARANGNKAMINGIH